MRTEVVSAESLSVRQPAGVEEIKQLQSFLLQLLERVCWKGEEQIVVGGVEGMVTGAADGGRERAASSLRIACGAQSRMGHLLFPGPRANKSPKDVTTLSVVVRQRAGAQTALIMGSWGTTERAL
ncbi:unnamed protein product [Arctogadus glacialis]